jgi:hypothetical protein
MERGKRSIQTIKNPRVSTRFNKRRNLVRDQEAGGSNPAFGWRVPDIDIPEFCRAMVQRKYRLLFSSKGTKPGPKGQLRI